tara:strand:+ start:845 stop:1540 length:696 start_codon:yes stop_codon:yes gene_type:complete
MNLKNEITGQTKDHLIWSEEDKTYIHKEVFPKFQQLKKLSRSNGLELAILSGFRSFDTQKGIIEKKIDGTRPILDDNGKTKNPKNLTPSELLESILRWSALPGFSRHHWGTDFDIYDKNALPLGYKIQLIPEEYQKEGPFFKLSEWINELISYDKSLDFFLPYKEDLGGVAKEPWHISFSTLTPQYESNLTYNFFIKFIETKEIPLKNVILERAEEIYNRFIKTYFHYSTI